MANSENESKVYKTRNHLCHKGGERFEMLEMGRTTENKPV